MQMRPRLILWSCSGFELVASAVIVGAVASNPTHLLCENVGKGGPPACRHLGKCTGHRHAQNCADSGAAGTTLNRACDKCPGQTC
eukprot:1392179-Amphidinium_carterae.2